MSASTWHWATLCRALKAYWDPFPTTHLTVCCKLFSATARNQGSRPGSRRRRNLHWWHIDQRLDYSLLVDGAEAGAWGGNGGALSEIIFAVSFVRGSHTFDKNSIDIRGLRWHATSLCHANLMLAPCSLRGGTWLAALVVLARRVLATKSPLLSTDIF